MILDSSHLIGYHYYKDVMTGANTVWLGSGYMHFGFPGLLFYALLVGLLFSMVDILARRRELGISGAIIFTPFLALYLSSDLPTTMLTHGLLLAMILAWACRFKETLEGQFRVKM